MIEIDHAGITHLNAFQAVAGHKLTQHVRVHLNKPSRTVDVEALNAWLRTSVVPQMSKDGAGLQPGAQMIEVCL